MTGTVPPPLEAELTAALSARAAAVEAAPTPDARAAVDRRRADRRRRRARRAGAGAVVVTAAALALGSVGAQRRATDGATEPAADVVAGHELDPADDPAAAGLPRLALDPLGGLRARVEEDPLVEVEPRSAEGDALAGIDRVRVVRPAGALVPAVYLPSPGPDRDPATSVALLSAGPAGDRTWTGRAAGWGHYDAALADPATRPAYGFGVDEGTLADAGAGTVPAGFVAHEVTADPGDAAGPPATPGYRIRYQDEGVEGGLQVWVESDLRREVALLRVLAGAELVAAVEVGGRPGLLARHPGGAWSVGWSPADGVTAALVVAGAGVDRAQVEVVAGAVRAFGEREWAAMVAGGRS
jgi:hypothetical protein